MSQENVEMVRVMVEAFKRRDSTGASESLHADVECGDGGLPLLLRGATFVLALGPLNICADSALSLR